MDKSQVPSIIIGKLLNLGGMLQRHGNKMLMPFDLNQQQFSILFEIAMVDHVQQKDMVNRLMLERAHVSKVVRKLEQMNLISISSMDNDRRSALLSITKKGEKLVDECRKNFTEWNQEWIGDIDESQYQTILDYLSLLQTVFKSHIFNKENQK